ncbi:hypothetical protein DPMN_054464 [Dreissena polymorpha]|uniref:Uncharacterized protein n=1 Tax=Dreissena polymorpha TaxID=45954 RepID=A0A9D4CNY1_DREPO|nr:hypothetical protein DPMN_054464 [Dreissena polymorpha]
MALASSVDPDETPHDAVSHQGLRCLLKGFSVSRRGSPLRCQMSRHMLHSISHDTKARKRSAYLEARIPYLMGKLMELLFHNLLSLAIAAVAVAILIRTSGILKR